MGRQYPTHQPILNAGALLYVLDGDGKPLMSAPALTLRLLSFLYPDCP